MSGARLQYAVLVVFLLIAAFHAGGNIAWVTKALLHPETVPSAPFSIRNGTRVIGNGPLRGDQILSIDGKPFAAKQQYDDAVFLRRPNGTIHLVLSEPSGRAVETTVRIGDQSALRSSAASVALTLCLDVFVPVVCFGLAFAVAFIRPRDPNAWLLLFLLVGFGGLLGTTDWYSPFPDLKLIWTAFCNSAWALAMLLFAIYFPTRLEPDRRRPWIKYILLIPSAGISLVLWTTILVWTHSISAARVLEPWFVGLSRANLAMQMCALGAFFAVLAVKSRAEKSPDDARRLTILRRGSQLAFTPMFPIVLYAVVAQKDILVGIPWPLEAFAFFMMALFPVTLVYVIVVERAMDLRVAVRQSVKYTLARGGLRIIRGSLLAACIFVFSTNVGHTWRPVLLAGAIAGIILIRKKNMERASVWVDKKFFREAYNAELLLSELVLEVGRYVEIDPLLQTVARRIADTLHVDDIVIMVRDGDIYRTRYSTRMGEPMDIAVSSHLLTLPAGQPEPLQVYLDKPQSWMRTLDTTELQTLAYMRSEVLLALRGQGSQDTEIIGIMSLGAKKSGEPYSKTDLRLLQTIAVQMGMALHNSRLAASLASEAAHREVMNRELEIAREVQERLFPQKFPKIEGIDCFGFCRPARGVGGDYFDFIDLGAGRIGIAIGDVSGKGIAAALLMASLQASLRGQTLAGVRDLGELMHNVNKLVYESSQSNRYATFFYGEFDPATRQFTYVNAGHNAPVILRGDEVIRLEASGPVVGLLPGAGYQMEAFEMQPGDIFVGYTDGISEALNEQEEEWEEDRFIAAAKAACANPAKQVAEAIFRGADAFTGSARQYDDMTLLVMKIAA